MRQVGEAELVWKIVTALRRVRASTWKEKADPRREVSDRAMVTIASAAAAGLLQLEILSEAPDAPDATFTRPLARMAGEDVPTGGVPIE